MSKEVKFDVVTRTTYVVTDVSPEDGITFDYTDWMEKARRMNLKWQSPISTQHESQRKNHPRKFWTS